ncbi:zf-HC2 domain-containing protein [bacterium]|nr:zf-HC2 domain-containing protein [bacterium]
MKCKNVLKLLSAYLDGELDKTRMEQISEHLETCETCRAHLLQLQEISDSIKSFAWISPPPRFEDVVLAKARNPVSERHVSIFDFLINPSPRFALSVCSTLLLFFLAVFYLDLVPQQQHIDELIAENETVPNATDSHSDIFTRSPGTSFVRGPMPVKQRQWQDFFNRTSSPFTFKTYRSELHDSGLPWDQKDNPDYNGSSIQFMSLNDNLLVQRVLSSREQKVSCPSCFRRLDGLSFRPSSRMRFYNLSDQHPQSSTNYNDLLVRTANK